MIQLSRHSKRLLYYTTDEENSHFRMDLLSEPLMTSCFLCGLAQRLQLTSMRDRPHAPPPPPPTQSYSIGVAMFFPFFSQENFPCRT